jgi:RNA polymerase sigma-70 factor (ECF subfamily)
VFAVHSNPSGGVDARAPVLRADLDAASRAWLDGLAASGPRHDACVRQLHALLVRIARHEVARRAGPLRVRGPELDDIADQAGDDALMAIKSKVSDFRGESRFTTWAYRFVMLEVSSKLGRHFWRHRAIDLDQAQWERLPDQLAHSPHEHAEQRELFVTLRQAIEHDLTDLQRRVFTAVILDDVPMDAFAREVGSNRNAVYKALFDARSKLRTRLAAAGYSQPVAPGESS